MTNDEMTNEEKIVFFFNKSNAFSQSKIKVHIVLTNGRWYNGSITDIRPQFIMLNEREDGMMPIFYTEMHSISKMEERKNG